MRASSPSRAALFTVVGGGFFAVWLEMLAPGFAIPTAPSDWLGVLSFSALLVTEAVALPTFARLAGGRAVFRTSLVPALGAALAGVANILEDGLHVEWAFYLFVLSSLITLVGLSALGVVIVFTETGRRRYLAAMPAAMALGQLLFTLVGGVLMLAAWLAAAAAALGWVGRQRIHAPNATEVPS